MSVSKGLRAVARSPSTQKGLTAEMLVEAGYPAAGTETGESFARKLSAVDRCIEILSDSMGKLPCFIMDSRTRERVDLPILQLLNVRPNEAMTPFIRKKVLETSRLVNGNGYDWIVRDPKSGRPVELIPVPGQLVEPWRDSAGRVWYTVTHPWTGEPMVLPNEDICHYKTAARDGLKGVGVLRRASETIASARAQQQYELSYYQSGGQPSGILRTEADLGGSVQDPKNPGQLVSRKDLLRREWERVHAGPLNGHRIAIMDFGLDYKPLASSNQDAQFVESREVTVRDIARYFGVPLYKLQEGKQAYGSNEQNAIEYVVGTLHPNVTQYEEEKTWKLLLPSQVNAGLEIRINMMAELRGDTAARGQWYRDMTEVGGFCVNDIMDLEDMPHVPGGDERRASLNYVPLRDWAELSRLRAQQGALEEE